METGSGKRMACKYAMMAEFAGESLLKERGNGDAYHVMFFLFMHELVVYFVFHFLHASLYE